MDKWVPNRDSWGGLANIEGQIAVFGSEYGVLAGELLAHDGSGSIPRKI